MNYYVCVYVCIYIYVSRCIYIYMYSRILCICVYVGMYTCMNVRVCRYISV